MFDPGSGGDDTRANHQAYLIDVADDNAHIATEVPEVMVALPGDFV